MNKVRWTVIISLAATAVLSAGVPLAVIHLGEPRGALGWVLLLFMVFNPFLLAVIGVASGLQWRKLWWLPLVCAVLMPLLYGVVFGDFNTGLWGYTPFYLLAGYLPFGITYGIVMWREKKEESVDAQK